MGEAENTLESSRIGMLINGGLISETSTLENSCHVYPGYPLKYKPRKSSAARDFPKGCGRFTPRVNGRASEDAIAVGAVENSKARVESSVFIKPNPMKQLGISIESKVVEFVKSSVAIEMPDLSKDVKSGITIPLSSYEVEELESTEIVREPVGMDFEKAFDQTISIDSLKTLESETTNSSKKLNQMEIPDLMNNFDRPSLTKVLENFAQTEQMDTPGSLRLQSSAQPSIPVVVVMEKDAPKKYLRPRRISATRDFPPGCGRNTARVSKEEIPNAVASSKRTLGNENSIVGNGLLEESVRTDAKQIREEVQEVDVGKLKGNIPNIGGKLQVKSLIDETTETREHFQVTTSCGSKMEREGTKEISARTPHEDNLSLSDPISQTVSRTVDRELGSLERKVGKEPVKHIKDKSCKRKFTGESEDESGTMNLSRREVSISFKPFGDRVILQALMAAPNCPWRQGKQAFKSNPTNGTAGNKGKKLELMDQDKSKSVSRKKNNEGENSEGKSTKKELPPEGKAACPGIDQQIVKDDENLQEHDEEYENILVGQGDDCIVTRNKVRETLRLFQAIFRKLLQEEEAKSKEQRNTSKRIDLQVASLLKEKQKWVNIGKKIMGHVPGVEVGDEFHFRVELVIIGLHHQFQGGIDYIKEGGKILATSIVASKGYANDMDSSDVLTYCGQGGNPMNGDKHVEDQKLERGNLSMKNSIDAQTPVRVIRGFKETKVSNSVDTRGKILATYTYYGLYLVEKYWQEIGRYGKLIFKFQLRRIPGQLELALKEVKSSKKSNVRKGLCVDDISLLEEKMSICAVNTIDDEKPPLFNYINNMIYPKWYKPTPPRGCDCTNGCSDSEKCSCAVKNGGEIPFNYDGAIVEAKPLIYECGPSCKCPPSCHNRVSQRGIKFQLEIFKTTLRGWGVRSLMSIPSGSFICEYTGELLQDKEAEQRTGNDEYLFDIGHNYNDHTLWDGLSTLVPDLHLSSCEVVEDVGFTIDAAQNGNVGRFINHSCSPNLYAQNVLYDHDDKRMPHIMLFAMENIPPLQELTYHYNYVIDQVCDLDGNIKKKSCYCGSSECTGRMY